MKLSMLSLCGALFIVSISLGVLSMKRTEVQHMREHYKLINLRMDDTAKEIGRVQNEYSEAFLQ